MVCDRSTTGDQVLDEALRLMGAPGTTPRTTEQWVEIFSGEALSQVRLVPSHVEDTENSRHFGDTQSAGSGS